MSRIHLLAVTCLVALGTVASAQVVNFEDVPNNGVSGFTLHGDTVISGGFSFASMTQVGNPQAIASWTADSPSFYTGSVAIFANFGGDSLLMTQVGGGVFDVLSIGVADVFLSASTNQVTLIGTLPDLTTVQHQFNLATGSTMQSYNVASMTGIVSMQIMIDVGQPPQIDNIVTAVPEPGTFLAIGVGLAVLAFRRRR